MNNLPDAGDMRVFLMVARKASFTAAAEAIGMSAAYMSKRVQVLEQVLGVRLLHRTTRQVALTEEGERVFEWCRRILDEMEQMVQETARVQGEPVGSLRISCSFGFGRQVVAPAIAALVTRHPRLDVRFEVFDRLVDVAAEGFDLDIRIGDDIAPHLVARRLANNHRVLCAAPAYLARRGTPRHLQDLANHDCLVIKERDHPFGVWRLQHKGGVQAVKVTGPLSSNQGEIVVQWAMHGHGILLRSLWQVGPMLATGELVRVLPDYWQDANVWAVYPSRRVQPAKTRVCVAFLQEYFQQPHGFGLVPAEGSPPPA